MASLTIEKYSEKSFVVRGSVEDTKTNKENFKRLQGKFNPNLIGGAGWIFSNKQREAVEAYIKNDNINNNEEKLNDRIKEKIRINERLREKSKTIDQQDKEDELIAKILRAVLSEKTVKKIREQVEPDEQDD